MAKCRRVKREMSDLRGLGSKARGLFVQDLSRTCEAEHSVHIILCKTQDISHTM
jgi:hypothetical protein